MRARLLLLVSALSACSIGRAGPLSMEPLLGVTTDYASNPYLLSAGAHEVSDVALLMNAPTHYDLDAAHFALLPSIRYTDSGSGGYASLASNYFHINGSASVSSDLNSIVFTAGFARDSSLYQNGLSSNGEGVRADGSTAGMEWQHAITERSQFVLDGSWSRELYDQNAESTGLVDYRYSSISPSVNFALSERDKIQVLAGGGQYVALDGVTKSKNLSLQLGFSRQLTELWNLSTSAGYAKSNNSENIYFGPYLLGTIESEQKGPVYNASLVRQGELFSLTASASRAFRPSGFAYLSRTDIGALDLKYTYSDRWTFAAKANYQETTTPLSTGPLSEARYYSGQLSADWHWTPEWVISLHTTWVSVKYELPPSNAQSTGVSLEISRQFLRIDL